MFHNTAFRNDDQISLCDYFMAEEKLYDSISRLEKYERGNLSHWLLGRAQFEFGMGYGIL
jgi:hypothetical protein